MTDSVAAPSLHIDVDASAMRSDPAVDPTSLPTSAADTPAERSNPAVDPTSLITSPADTLAKRSNPAVNPTSLLTTPADNGNTTTGISNPAGLNDPIDDVAPTNATSTVPTNASEHDEGSAGNPSANTSADKAPSDQRAKGGKRRGRAQAAAPAAPVKRPRRGKRSAEVAELENLGGPEQSRLRKDVAGK